MRSAEIRSAFLDYFRSKDHSVVSSSGLIPREDPTLLFTNAGMVQFKSVFTGDEKRSYSRAVTCQKCMRAGGKHNDIENVGHTARHHTFFEMLGNFSFGDYFKKDAIIYAWELLTSVYNLPVDQLWVSVYEKDDEAHSLWKENTGISADRIVRLGEKDNFWQMGDTGPCGPCSEIIIDQGSEMGCDRPDCSVGCDCDRYLEIWNLVFMQYDRNSEGVLTPLPKPSIDTGMGLERISAVLQGKHNNFDSDLFANIISSITSETGKNYNEFPETDISIRVIADHMRAATFLISEGIVPSNEGRGYVLRRVFRRASRHAKLMGIDSPILYRFIDPVIETFGNVYPEIVDERDRTVKVLKIEEERFNKTLQQGVNRFDAIIEELKRTGSDLVNGEELFKLYDTYGFPLDLARDMALDSGLRIDEDGFHKAMTRQKEAARSSWVTADTAVSGIYKEIADQHGPTEFVGYDTLECSSSILSLLKSGSPVERLAEGDTGELILDRTPFYGESGGQIGDIGTVTSMESRANVTNTKKTANGLHVHSVTVTKGSLSTGHTVECMVNETKRRSIMKNHTATHLLHTALRNVLGEHIKQSGSLVSDDKLRFDFTHFYGLSGYEITDVEDSINRVILENRNVKTEILSIDDALSAGATALFDEKYGDTVRVVSVEGFSKELCGGTHCRNTGEIGSFFIVSESSVASGIRRIEAVTGLSALHHTRTLQRSIKDITAMLKADNPVEKVQRILDENKSLRKEIENLKTNISGGKGTDITDSVKEVNGVKVLSLRQDNLSPDELRAFSDNIKNILKSAFVFLISVNNDSASMLATVTKDLQKKYHAGNILKRIATACGGKGGGSPHMAQGGTKELGQLDKALDMVYDIIKES